MAMTIKTDGIGALNAVLQYCGDKAPEIAAMSLYEGAAVVADAYAQAVHRINTGKYHYGTPENKRLPTEEEKAALMGKTGIAKFDKNGGEVNTIVGLSGNAGYAQLGNKQKAVIVIARSINSGTSFMNRQPVFRKAKNSSKGAAINAITAKAEEMLEEILNK